MPEKKSSRFNEQLIKVVPWVAGIGFAASQIASSSRCTAVDHSHCSKCGSCAIALVGLVGWALSKQKNREDFFIEK
jgi:peptide deformylase